MDDNTKFSIREYREVLYQEISKKRKNSQLTPGAASIEDDAAKRRDKEQR